MRFECAKHFVDLLRALHAWFVHSSTRMSLIRAAIPINQRVMNGPRTAEALIIDATEDPVGQKPETWTDFDYPGRRRTTWSSVVQAEFLKGLRLEKIELEPGQRFWRERLNLLLDFGRQRAELCFH